MEAIKKMEKAEDEFFSDKENSLFNWNMDSIRTEFEKVGFTVNAAAKIENEKRRLTESEISKWFDTSTSAYADKLVEAMGTLELKRLITLLQNAAGNMLFSWQSETAYFTICKK